MEVSNCWYRAHGYRWLLGTHVLSAPMTLFCRLAVPWGEVRLPENHVKGRTNSWTSKEKGKLLLPWMVCLHKGWQIGQTFLPQSSHQGQTPKQKRENAIVLEEEFALLDAWELKSQNSSAERGNENPKFLISFTLAIRVTSKGWRWWCITLALLKKLFFKSNRLVALERRWLLSNTMVENQNQKLS